MSTRSVLQRAKRSERDEGPISQPRVQRRLRNRPTERKQLIKDKYLSVLLMGVITRIDDRVNAPIVIIEKDDGTLSPLGGIR